MIGNLYKLSIVIQDSISIFVHLDSPGYHLQCRGHIGLCGSRIGGNVPEAIGTISRSTVLRPGYPVWSQGLMNFRGKFHLYPLVACLNSMGCSVVQGNPVRKDAMSVQAPDQKEGFGGSGKTLFALDLSHFRFIACPFGDIVVKSQICQQIFIIRKVGGINGDRCHTGVKHGRNLNLCRFHILRTFNPVMIRMNRHGDGYAQLVHYRIHLPGHVPVVHRTVSICPPLGLGYFNKYGGVCPLCRRKRPADHHMIPTVGGDGHSLAFPDHGPVDDLAAHNQRP